MAAQLALTAWAFGLAYEDWRQRRLSNALLLAGIVLGLAHWAAYGRMPLGNSISQGALAAAIALLALLPLYAAGWMGAGGVKFCAVIGWLAGWRAMLAVFLFGSIVAGVFALMLRIPACRRLMCGSGLEGRLKKRIPFGSGLAIALVVLMAGWVDPGIFDIW